MPQTMSWLLLTWIAQIIQRMDILAPHLESLKLRSHVACLRLYSSKGQNQGLTYFTLQKPCFLASSTVYPFSIVSHLSYTFLCSDYFPLSIFLCSKRPLAWWSGISAVTHICYQPKPPVNPSGAVKLICCSYRSSFTIFFLFTVSLVCIDTIFWILSPELVPLCPHMSLSSLESEVSGRGFSRWFSYAWAWLEREMGQVYECRNVRGKVTSPLGWTQEGCKFEACLVYMGRIYERVWKEEKGLAPNQRSEILCGQSSCSLPSSLSFTLFSLSNLYFTSNVKTYNIFNISLSMFMKLQRLVYHHLNPSLLVMYTWPWVFECVSVCAYVCVCDRGH